MIEDAEYQMHERVGFNPATNERVTTAMHYEGKGFPYPVSGDDTQRHANLYDRA